MAYFSPPDHGYEILRSDDLMHTHDVLVGDRKDGKDNRVVDKARGASHDRLNEAFVRDASGVTFCRKIRLQVEKFH